MENISTTDSVFDRLVKVLDTNYGYVEEERAEIVAKRLIRSGLIKEEKPSDWIPVTERLPEADEEVFIYLWDNPRAYIAWVDQEGRWKTDDCYVDKDYLPKAWLPLPKPYEPPKEK